MKTFSKRFSGVYLGIIFLLFGFYSCEENHLDDWPEHRESLSTTFEFNRLEQVDIEKNERLLETVQFLNYSFQEAGGAIHIDETYAVVIEWAGVRSYTFYMDKRDETQEEGFYN